MESNSIKIRKARKNDAAKILNVLKKTGLYFPSQSLTSFWVAEKSGKIIGVVRIRKQKDFFFLSSLGVLENYQKNGIASLLLKKAMEKSDKDIYLYTVIPNFFKRFGFMSTLPLPKLPSKKRLDCENCFPKKCVCMVHPHTQNTMSSGIPGVGVKPHVS